jgi:hypothetical protein
VKYLPDGRLRYNDDKQPKIADPAKGTIIDAPKTEAPKSPVAAPTRHKAGAENPSPDGKLAAFIRDNNLWVKTVATGAEKQLTTDGVTDFGYATDNAGWQHSDSAVLTWSADSKKIATFQLDQRKTGMMYLVSTTYRHPELEAWHYPLVGDKDVTMIQPVVIDVASATVVRLKTAPLEHARRQQARLREDQPRPQGRDRLRRRHSDRRRAGGVPRTCGHLLRLAVQDGLEGAVEQQCLPLGERAQQLGAAVSL